MNEKEKTTPEISLNDKAEEKAASMIKNGEEKTTFTFEGKIYRMEKVNNHGVVKKNEVRRYRNGQVALLAQN